MKAFRGRHSEWDSLIARLPNPHILQTWEWAQVKARYGWQMIPFTWQSQAAAMILKRTISIGGFSARMNVLYIPKGPTIDWQDATTRQVVLDDLQSFAKQQGAILLKIDPDVVCGTGVPGDGEAVEDPSGQAVKTDLNQRGWVFSPEQVQFRNTVFIDLTSSEDEILARMKQKTRYNIRLAEKKGVTVRDGTTADLPRLYKMYAETSVRDGFVIRDESYYTTVWKTFMPKAGSPSSEPPTGPFSVPLIAEVEGQPIAAIFPFYFAGRAYYLYGMSRNDQREKMPNHLLQWEAIKRAKAAGCRIYDLWGAPDEFNEHDGMWGVFRFKEGLGGQVIRTVGAWDFTTQPMLYKLYTQILPKILDIMRSRGKARTRRSFGGA